MKNKEKITFEEFLAIENKLEIKIGFITGAESVPKSYGLKLTVDFGDGDIRTVFTNIGKTHLPEQLIGLTMPFITNLAPSVIKGVNSEAMIMVGTGTEGQLQVGLNNFDIGTKLL
jgi:tRNA-binding EMAP/Myf-like protein